jgi:hypothetical protein
MFSTRFAWVVALALAVGALGCSGKKPKVEGQGKGKPTGGTVDADAGAPAEEPAAKEAEDQVASWLGKQASAKAAELTEKLASDLGFKIADDAKVQQQIKNLIGTILKAKAVKEQTDKIADKATSGFINKVKLGWKALQAGGVDEYKKKVKDDTTRIATDVIEAHVKNAVLKDPRMAQLMKKFMPILQLEAKIAAIPMQENMSPEASQKLLGLALKLSVAGKSKETAAKVADWSAKCDPHMAEALEKLFQKLTGLKSVETAVGGIAVDVVGHETTAREFATMMTNIMKDKDAHAAMTKAYENAAFDNGEKAVRGSIEKIVALPIVDAELFAALDRLAAAEGAPALIEKHFKVIGEDPEMAKLVDGFVIDLLSTCGDPSK